MPSASYPIPELTHFSPQADWLEAVPVVLTLPLGKLLVNYLLFRATCKYQADAKFIVKTVHEASLEKRSVEGRNNLLRSCAEHLSSYQRQLARLESFPAYRKLFYGSLVRRVTRIETELSDLVETLALGADPEIRDLAKELSDVL